MKPEISFVIPFKNEEKNLTLLCQKISAVMQRTNRGYEVILVDDGSTDNSLDEAKELAEQNSYLKIIVFQRNFGKSAGFSAGFAKAKGKYIITMDADLQDDPDEIPNFLTKLDKGYDLAVGWKKNRKDSSFFVNFSHLANWLIRKSTNLNIHDLNCGFKGFNARFAKSLNLYGEQFRFIPVFAQMRGFKVCEIAVLHHARLNGISKYQAGKAFRGLMDFFTVMFFSRYGTRPMHFFGGLGIISLIIGIIIALYLTIDKLVYHVHLSDRPLLLLAVLLIIFGAQLLSMGIITEVFLSQNLKAQDTYAIREIIGEQE